MSSQYQNKAAYQQDAKDTALVVQDAPYTSPGPSEIVVKNHAVAINPIDWILQQLGNSFIFQWLTYPMIMGYDVAGTVVEVGSGVTRFKVGDRVIGMAVGHDEHIKKYSEAAFQLYPVLREEMTTPIPDTLDFEHAVVVPLGAATAACGLYQSHLLNLQRPTVNPTTTGKTVLVWGGSSSVGLNAIQLARASGYEVVTTCSPRNFELVRRLGAAHAFDYNSPTIQADLIGALKDRDMAGALAMGDGAIDHIMCVMAECRGNKFVAIATKSKLPDPADSLATVKVVANFVGFNANLWWKAKTRGVRYDLIYADTLVHDGVGRAIFQDFLPAALAQGQYLVAPDPLVVGHGLDKIQEAYDVQRKGVSAKKVVVTL